ncbi:MAG: WecB/TagA/CpsF family glycosyltransferase [Patescibacteria group bacterium]
MPQILGVKLDSLSQEEVLVKIENFIKDGEQHYLVLPYSEFVVEANRDEQFRQILNQSDLSLCDGRGLLWAAGFLGQPLKEQILGVELTEIICRKYFKIFLFGGRKQVVEKTARKYDSHIIGWLDGYQDTEKAIEEINRVKPEIVLVALGMPKQEKWISRNLKKIPSVKLAVGVGGAFDFISGQIKRAPKFLQRIGLEWLWRLTRQPRRIKRIFKAVVVFSWLTIKARILKFPRALS